MTVMMVVASISTVFANDAELTIGDNLLGDGANTFASGLLGTVQFIGYAIAIGMLIYVGIKYVMASANEKAD